MNTYHNERDCSLSIRAKLEMMKSDGSEQRQDDVRHVGQPSIAEWSEGHQGVLR